MDIKTPALPFRMRLTPHKNSIYIGILCLLLVLIFAIKMGGEKQKNEADFVSATNAFVKWEEVLDKEHDELKNLSTQVRI